MNKLRVGVIGCGAGMFHVEGYSEDPRCDLVGLAGLDTHRCLELQRKHNIPQIFGDYTELLAQTELDAVSIAVPNFLHLPIAKACLEAGKHVLIEKPIARNAAEGQEMVEIARKAGKILMVSYQRRNRADIRFLHKAIANGDLGEIYYAKAFWMRRSGIPGLGSWFTSKNQAGGGPLIDLGVHVIDMLLYVMGNPEVTTVSASTYSKIGPQGKGNWNASRFVITPENRYEVEDLATAFMRTADGASIHLETSWAGYSGHTDEFGLSVMGTKGGAEIHVKDYNDAGSLRMFGDVDGVMTDTVPRLPLTKGHILNVKNFLDSIIDGTPVSPSGEEGVQRAALIDAIYRSAELGRETMVGE